MRGVIAVRVTDGSVRRTPLGRYVSRLADYEARLEEARKKALAISEMPLEEITPSNDLIIVPPRSVTCTFQAEFEDASSALVRAREERARLDARTLLVNSLWERLDAVSNASATVPSHMKLETVRGTIELPVAVFDALISEIEAGVKK